MFLRFNVKTSKFFYYLIIDLIENITCTLNFTTKYPNGRLTVVDSKDIRYDNNGILFGSEYRFGEMTLFPSKEIRDWNKWVELKCYKGNVGIGDYVVGLVGDGTI